EVIDLLAVLNALRAARSPVRLTDFTETHRTVVDANAAAKGETGPS
ncbi:MAG: hypothetical protein FD138_1969, partial [Planctomycetota bacterium]